jgi:head-tail adaptor
MKNKSFEEIVKECVANNTKKEETNMTHHSNSIYAAIRVVNSNSFRNEMKEELWRTPNIQLSYHKLWYDDDTTMVIKFFGQKSITERELNSKIIKFCNIPDSKERCRKLEAAFRHGDYLIKKGHVDGRMVIIVQILVD